MDSWANIRPATVNRWDSPTHTEPTESRINYKVGSFTMSNRISYAGMKVIWRKK